MTSKKTTKITAVKFRLILIGLIVVLLGISAVGFWFFTEKLTQFATEVQVANAAATMSNGDIQRLGQLEKELEDDKVAVTRAKNIVADSQYYQYQDQIIEDITAYAKASGLSVMSISFAAGTTGTAGAPTAAPTTATPAPAGLKSISASVTLKSPVDYKKFMQFVHAIELNLTKMQLTGISMTLPDDGVGVNVDPLTVEVYTR